MRETVAHFSKFYYYIEIIQVMEIAQNYNRNINTIDNYIVTN